MSLCIAVAEDDEAHRTVFVRVLEALGYDVPVSVGDGHELVDSCKSVKIDLVFADFHLS
jgi:CheY-like chemotaxis protein